MQSKPPRRWAVALRATRIFTYTLALLFGLTGLVFTPQSTEDQVGVSITFWWSMLAMMGAVVSIFGSASKRYRFEWAGVWFAAGAALMYAMSVGGFAAQGRLTELPQLFISLGFFMFHVYRGFELTAYAAELRARHTGEVCPSHDPGEG